MALGSASARLELEYVSHASALDQPRFCFLTIPSAALTRRRRWHANVCQPNGLRCQCDVRRLSVYIIIYMIIFIYVMFTYLLDVQIVV